MEDKYEIAQKRVGQLTADLGQREMQLEDLQREYRLWIREWKDEKAEMEQLRLSEHFALYPALIPVPVASTPMSREGRITQQIDDMAVL